MGVMMYRVLCMYVHVCYKINVKTKKATTKEINLVFCLSTTNTTSKDAIHNSDNSVGWEY